MWPIYITVYSPTKLRKSSLFGRAFFWIENNTKTVEMKILPDMSETFDIILFIYYGPRCLEIYIYMYIYMLLFHFVFSLRFIECAVFLLKYRRDRINWGSPKY